MFQDTDLLWFLVPLFMYFGFVLGKRGSERTSGQRVSRLSSKYFRGLNYLLNEQQDKAIEIFLEIADRYSDTIETQLALGNLFRRRGEVDRAIRLHQKLFERPRLTAEQRLAALLELGEDYMKAGLLDRAETLFLDLLQIEPNVVPALEQLLQIYEQEQDWPQAIQIAERLHRVTGRPMGPQVAHFHCELADRARAKGDLAAAREHLQAARRADPRAVRPDLTEGKIALEQGDRRAALEWFARVGDLDRDYIAEVVAPIQRCAADPERIAEARAVLERFAERDPTLHALIALIDLVARQEGPEPAEALLRRHLRGLPSMRGLERLLKLELERGGGMAGCEVLRQVHDVVQRYLERKASYRCLHCGFGSKQLHWNCPSCKSWGSTKPVPALPGE